LILRRIDTFDDLPRFARNKKVTYIQATPFHVVTLLKLANVEEMLLPDLRVLCTSTAPVSPEQRQRARQHITANICEIYGGNEFGSVSWATPEDQDKYPQSVGRVIEQVDVEIVDDESRALPVGEVGLVRFRTPGAVKGYIANPVMTAHHFRDGWFYPGDVARMNAEGYLFLLGRADDIINNTGIKFYPIEVETVLLNYPGVREAAVFAYPHEIAGQLAAAVVVADDDVDLADLRAHAVQHLAAHKIPWLMSKANSLPRNKMGKILKRRLARVLQSRQESMMAPYSK
jgi:acyl-coenzyme A synthetase/AMP-(fatty) acid ligase